MEGPILFSTPMVQAILKKIKRKTRRIAKLPKETHRVEKISDNEFEVYWGGYMPDVGGFIDGSTTIKCPYGNIGDILWVRETWQQLPSGFDELPPEDWFIYKASDELSSECTGWRPSIHMPRKACRIRLKITDIHIERLQDITEEDAIAEGIRGWTKDGNLYRYCVGEVGDNGNVWSEMPRTAKLAFRKLWDSLNEPRGSGWDTNPFVWVISFERI